MTFNTSNKHAPRRPRVQETPDSMEEETIVYRPTHGVNIYQYFEDCSKKFAGKATDLNEAQNKIRSIRATEVENKNKVTDHFVLFWIDQFGDSHYQRWAADMHDVFAYTGKYAAWANEFHSFTSKRPIRYVDPPIEASEYVA